MLPSPTTIHRKFAGICIVFLAGLLITSSASATIEIAPGKSAALAPEACAEASGYKLPLDPTWGTCLLGCRTSCDLSASAAYAWLDVDRVVGSKYATSTIYGQFTVADPNGLGTEVDSTIQYDVRWAGLWTIAGFFTGYNEAKAEISIYLYDVTNGGKLIWKTEPPVHTQTPDGFIGIDLFDAGAGLDKGSTSNSFSAKLIRGHTYRVAMSLHVTAKGLANAYINLDYMYAGQGLFWNKFIVSVSPDINERIFLLEERVDSLEAEVTRLRFGLENHTHTYLTGKGVGHNNTAAQTSESTLGGEIDVIAPTPLPASTSTSTSTPKPGKKGGKIPKKK